MKRPIGLTVADLHERLGRLVERGRGGDEVTFGWTSVAEIVVTTEARRVLEMADWTLREVRPSADDDWFVNLQFEPTHLGPDGSST